MQEQAYIQIQDIFCKIDQILQSKQPIKLMETQVMKQLTRIKNLVNTNKNQIDQDQKNHIYVKDQQIQGKQKKIKQTIQKMKPMVLLKSQQRLNYRQQIIAVIKTIQAKIVALYQKKDNKKRQNSLQFFKFHQARLSVFAQWLLSPSRKFSVEYMKSLMKYLNDLHLSYQDKIFEDELRQLYQKISFTAQQTFQLVHQMFVSSYNFRPKINDYLLSKQTKESTYRNSICPNYKMIDLSVMPKMSKQILFLMFYFHKGQIQQYLAAKQLMANSWRYYKKFNIWLKRVSQATVDSSNQYQTGNYYCYGAQLTMRERKGIKVYHRYLIQQL